MNLKYYCDETFNEESNFKWHKLVDYATKKCDSVEFNILDKKYNNDEDIKKIERFIIEKGKRKDKVFPSGNYLRYELTDNVKTFIKGKNFSDWLNYYLEDISFLSNGVEVLLTITHENYVIILMEAKEILQLNKEGYSFVEWAELDDFC